MGTIQCDLEDKGQNGGLPDASNFVIVGDLNADPCDGGSVTGAAQLLLDHPAVNAEMTPRSDGAVAAARDSGGINKQHEGDPALDTGDFNDERVGNLRVDYVLPSRTLTLVDCGVFWPEPSSELSYLLEASDHHLVWIDVQLPSDPLTANLDVTGERDNRNNTNPEARD